MHSEWEGQTCLTSAMQRPNLVSEDEVRLRLREPRATNHRARSPRCKINLKIFQNFDHGCPRLTSAPFNVEDLVFLGPPEIALFNIEGRDPNVIGFQVNFAAGGSKFQCQVIGPGLFYINLLQARLRETRRLQPSSRSLHGILVQGTQRSAEEVAYHFLWLLQLPLLEEGACRPQLSSRSLRCI